MKANRPFFLVVLLIVLSVGGYFWWQAGFTFDVSRFFAAPVQCTTSGDLVCRQNNVVQVEDDPDTGHCIYTNIIERCGSGTCVENAGNAYCRAAATPAPTPTPTSTSGGGGGTDPCAGLTVIDSHDNAKSCLISETFSSDRCTIKGKGTTLTRKVKIVNNQPAGSHNLYSKPAIFYSATQTCGAHAGGSGNAAGYVSGSKEVAPGSVGTVTYTFTIPDSCGSWQLDDQWGPINLDVIGKVINTGVSCTTPTPTTSTSPTPTPSTTVSPTPTALVCAPKTQQARIGQPVTWTATGGTPPYSWQGNWETAIGNTVGATPLSVGVPSSGRGPTFTSTFSAAGTYSVTVSGFGRGQSDTCSVTINPVVTTTVTPERVACAPAQQAVNVGQTATVTASGGTGTYGWTAPTGKPDTGSGASFGTAYDVPGLKSIVVDSGGNQAVCLVTVNAVATSQPPVPPLVCSPATQTVQLNQTASFTATGGNPADSNVSGGTAQYTWSAQGGTPASGTGATFSTAYAVIGAKVVTVMDSANQSATCAVTVETTPTPTTPLITIVKQVRNVTQNGSEADNVNANPGDTVEFSLRVSSVGSATATHVIVADGPPAGLIFQPGTTTIDGVRSADITPNSDASALVLGDMAPGRTITVRFSATVAPASFFTTGTTVLTNTGWARADNAPAVTDTAFVTVMNAPQSLSMSLVKMGRNITRGQTGEYTPVYSSPAQTLEFVLRVRNTSNAPLTNVMLRDILPASITAIAGSVRIGGSPAPDALTGAGLSLGTLAVGQEMVVTFQGRVAVAAELPAGTTTLINTVTATATGVGTLTAQLPIIIANEVIVVPPVQTGPGESTVLALIISGIITLLYVGYTSTDTYRRREVGELAKETKDSTFNFRR